jgi:hypothetical protein
MCSHCCLLSKTGLNRSKNDTTIIKVRVLEHHNQFEIRFGTLQQVFQAISASFPRQLDFPWCTIFKLYSRLGKRVVESSSVSAQTLSSSLLLPCREKRCDEISKLQKRNTNLCTASKVSCSINGKNCSLVINRVKDPVDGIF